MKGPFQVDKHYTSVNMLKDVDLSKVDFPKLMEEIRAAQEEGKGFPDTGEYDSKREDHVRNEIQHWAAYAETGTPFDPEGKYLCGDCHERLEPKDCMWVEGPISMTTGSCRLWVHGPEQQATKKAPFQLTQIEAQYAERPQAKAFGCSRCEHSAQAKKPDGAGRPSWCSFWGLHVIPNACCAVEDGPDTVEAPGSK